MEGLGASVAMGLMMIIGLVIPIGTLVFVILIYNKVKKIEKNVSGQ